MLGHLFTNWTSIVLLLMGVGYLLLIQYLAKREARPRELSEAELLTKIARMGPHSEYDIFRMAAREWHVLEYQIDLDFKKYLIEGPLPYYVNSYLRQAAKKIGNIYRPPFIFGGGSLPWLK